MFKWHNLYFQALNNDQKQAVEWIFQLFWTKRGKKTRRNWFRTFEKILLELKILAHLNKKIKCPQWIYYSFKLTNLSNQEVAHSTDVRFVAQKLHKEKTTFFFIHPHLKKINYIYFIFLTKKCTIIPWRSKNMPNMWFLIFPCFIKFLLLPLKETWNFRRFSLRR